MPSLIATAWTEDSLLPYESHSISGKLASNLWRVYCREIGADNSNPCDSAHCLLTRTAQRAVCWWSLVWLPIPWLPALSAHSCAASYGHCSVPKQRNLSSCPQPVWSWRLLHHTESKNKEYNQTNFRAVALWFWHEAVQSGTAVLDQTITN